MLVYETMNHIYLLKARYTILQQTFELSFFFKNDLFLFNVKISYVFNESNKARRTTFLMNHFLIYCQESTSVVFLMESCIGKKKKLNTFVKSAEHVPCVKSFLLLAILGIEC